MEKPIIKNYSSDIYNGIINKKFYHKHNAEVVEVVNVHVDETFKITGFDIKFECLDKYIITPFDLGNFIDLYKENKPII